MNISYEERSIVELAATYVDKSVKPVVQNLEHNNTYPEEIIEEMKEMGVFGLSIPSEYSDFSVSTACYALVTEEIARGWMSLSGAYGGHSVVAKIIAAYGTVEQKERYLPRMATGELRATMALTEAGGGSDLQAIRTVAKKDGSDWVINGSKMWITNARHAGLIALLCKTDPAATPRHKGISIILVEKIAGVEVSRDLKKLGYKGIETCELSFDNVRVPAEAVLGGEPGKGFKQFMAGLEVGRIQVAGRAIGIARAAYDDAIRYAQERESFGKKIWQHQSIGNYLADMATSIRAAQLLNQHAATVYDAGGRADVEAGMAKLFASETALEVSTLAMRIFGGYGYSTEFDIERYYRDAPLMVVGEGTNEIQRSVIAKGLVGRSSSSLLDVIGQ